MLQMCLPARVLSTCCSAERYDVRAWCIVFLCLLYHGASLHVMLAQDKRQCAGPVRHAAQPLIAMGTVKHLLCAFGSGITAVFGICLKPCLLDGCHVQVHRPGLPCLSNAIQSTYTGGRQPLPDTSGSRQQLASCVRTQHQTSP